jgi:hypothetical protein
LSEKDCGSESYDDEAIDGCFLEASCRAAELLAIKLIEPKAPPAEAAKSAGV